MGSLSEGEDQFFDACDENEINSVSDSSSDCSENLNSDMHISIGYVAWGKNLSSISERRKKFLSWIGQNADQGSSNASRDASFSEVEMDMDRVVDDSGTVLQSSSFDNGLSSTQSLTSGCSDARDSLGGAMEKNLACRIRNLDSGVEFILDEFQNDGLLSRVREVGSNRLLTYAEFEKSLGLSPRVQQVMRKDIGEASNQVVGRTQAKIGWLKRLGVAACVIDRQLIIDGEHNGPYRFKVSRDQIVRVRSHKKRSKEFSALYMRQDIPAHQGSILTMKFSPDGQYLASAGEDRVVRVWQVLESESSDVFHTFYIDPSYVYFTFNNRAELVPLFANKEMKGRFKSELPKSDSVCVIFPQKVFQLSAKPIHEFYGHSGDILDLAWSTNKCLLSSSTDRTVRLWQVGRDQCRKVFPHNDYVTCVQFNPVDNNYFISGSIDGKVRIWEIPSGQVVEWIDIGEIVTAACYHPDGKGVVVGSMTGNCRFYDATDNCLQLYAQMCTMGKKKTAYKRITGFQFCPHDPAKLLVTSADSKIRILQGVDVICKYQGLRNAGSASFTRDGMHVVSVSEDSNIYVWNFVKQDVPAPALKKNWSCERFFSTNVSVAIPWCGITSSSSIPLDTSTMSLSRTSLEQCMKERDVCRSDLHDTSPQGILSSSSSNNFSLGIFLDSLPKGSATWPAETLPPSSRCAASATYRSQYKLLRTSCQSFHGSQHAWGMVIVTAGWDGRIKSFQNYGLPIRP